MVVGFVLQDPSLVLPSMSFLPIIQLLCLLLLVAPAAHSTLPECQQLRPNSPVTVYYGSGKIEPKVFIISLYSSEGEAWFGIPEFDILSRNITIPGFSPLFPDAHCTNDGTVCQVTTGEAEINAALTMSALIHSSVFDLTSTYFLIAGVAGVNPKLATIGSVTFARFAVQVALQYEFDAREKPADSPTGYIPLDSKAPWEYPGTLYGTEVYEVNEALRELAVSFALKAELADSSASKARRSHYAVTSTYAAGAAPPSVVKCDTATSDNFWSGNLLGEAFENTTSLFTNGTGIYCTSQQEDNAVLGALLRGALWGAVDFSRIIVMRSASDFDRPPPGQSAAENLFSESPGYPVSLQNTYRAGVRVVEGILDAWEDTFEAGIPPPNRIGDVFDSLSKRKQPRECIRIEPQAVFDWY